MFSGFRILKSVDDLVQVNYCPEDFSILIRWSSWFFTWPRYNFNISSYRHCCLRLLEYGKVPMHTSFENTEDYFFQLLIFQQHTPPIVLWCGEKHSSSHKSFWPTGFQWDSDLASSQVHWSTPIPDGWRTIHVLDSMCEPSAANCPATCKIMCFRKWQLFD